MRTNVMCLTLFALLFALSVSAQAQQPTEKVARIGMLRESGAEESYIQVFLQGLKELGWVDRQNVTLEPRSGKPEQYSALLAELVNLKVDLIVVDSTGPALAAKKVTSAIPIVMTTSTDPVGTGLVASLARPGGNITGLSSNARVLGGKNLELLKEIAPKLSRVVLPHPGSPADKLYVKDTEAPARALGVQVTPIVVRSQEDFSAVFRTAAKERSNGVLSRLTPRTSPAQRKQFVELVAKNRLPAIYVSTSWVDSGGLMSYGPDRIAMYRRAAYYVDRILKGAKPADLPVEQPTKFEFVINLKTAKQIGLKIPPEVLARADRVVR
jgi:putative tryptophan/tyrosine transport system substrate-binding protein